METDNAIRCGGLTTVKQNSAFVTQSITSKSENTGGEFTLFRQYVSPPLAAPITLIGPIKSYFRAHAHAGWPTTDSYNSVAVRIFNNDGTVEKPGGTWCFWEAFVDSAQFAATFIDRLFVVASIGNLSPGVECVAGDRIVIEVGTNASWMGYPTTTFIEFGDNSPNDLPENETSTDQYCPWIEFGDNFTFAEEGSPPTGGETTRDFPTINPETTWQSQAGKRKFPL